nr:MAG TPA: hypothetical protein [Caudoviricetes sp.]
MSAMKVTQLSTDEVNQTIIDNKLENIYVLTPEPTKLYRIIDMQIGAVLRHIRKGSAFIRLEISADDSRTEE